MLMDNRKPVSYRAIGTQDPSLIVLRVPSESMPGKLDIGFTPHSQNLEVICLVIVMIPLKRSTSS